MESKKISYNVLSGHIDDRPAVLVSIPICKRYTLTRVRQVDEITKRVMFVTKKALVDCHKYDHMTPEDFSIENLTAAGVSITPLSLSLSVHENLSLIESGIESIVKSSNK